MFVQTICDKCGITILILEQMKQHGQKLGNQQKRFLYAIEPETQFRILHHLQITPQLRHRMNLNLTEMCSKCHVEVGCYRHCVWSCVYIEEYWHIITDKLSLIFGVNLDPDPQDMFLGLPSPHIKGSDHRRLFNILTFAARKNMLLKWIDNAPPTIILFNLYLTR